MTKIKSKIKTSTEYDTYYTKDINGRSLYDKQFMGKVNPRETEAIKRLVKKNMLRVKPDPVTGERIFKLCDFGCGDGRFLPLFHEIANDLKKHSIKLEVVNYDPNQLGLEQYIKRLKDGGYANTVNNGFQDVDERPENKKAYHVGAWEKDNLKFTFVHGHECDSVKHLGDTIGPVTATMAIFGVLSHIPGGIRRVMTLSMLGDITDGQLIVTVPTHRRFAKEDKLFKTLRKEGHDTCPANEDDDVMYVRHDKDTGLSLKNYIHLYSSQTLKHDCALAGIKLEGGVQGAKILNESYLTHHSKIAKIDKFVSKHLPSKAVNGIAEYFLIVGEKPKTLKKGLWCEERNKEFAETLQQERDSQSDQVAGVGGR